MKKRRRFLPMILLCILWLCFVAADAASADVIAIKAGKLVDPKTGTAADNQIILIDGARITAVGSNLRIPKEARVVDLSTSAVLPGLFDCHTHLCLFIKTQAKSLDELHKDLLLATVDDSTGYRVLQGAANALSMLEAGFTTVRDMGNAGNYADIDLRRAIDEGLAPGPKVLVSGKIIAPFGGQVSVNPEHVDLGKQDYIYADTRDEIKKAIRRNIHFGADWIKIVVDSQKYAYSAEDIRFIVDESAKAGLKVAAHAVAERSAGDAVEAGVASIEHGFLMNDAALASARKNGVMLVGTPIPEDQLRAVGMDNFYPIIINLHKRAYKAGIEMAFGTDAIVPFFGKSRGELSVSYVDSLVAADIPAKEILRMMTTNAAKLLGLEKERGVIAPGMMADIIAAAGNPLDDIRTLKDVVFVMKEGKVYKQK